jgi:hypothetical protein
MRSILVIVLVLLSVSACDDKQPSTPPSAPTAPPALFAGPVYVLPVKHPGMDPCAPPNWPIGDCQPTEKDWKIRDELRVQLVDRLKKAGLDARSIDKAPDSADGKPFLVLTSDLRAPFLDLKGQTIVGTNSKCDVHGTLTRSTAAGGGSTSISVSYDQPQLPFSNCWGVYSSRVKDKAI